MATEEDVLLDTIKCPRCELTEIEMTRIYVDDPVNQHFDEYENGVSGGYEFSSKGIFSNVTYRTPNFKDLINTWKNVSIKKYK